jgi:GNAT superfamily N-acetyltransferase
LKFAELHICFTDPDYQRRGIGSMMLQWGCDLADQLFLPSWVEASPTGNFLYRKYGYTDVDVKKGGDMAGSLMRREVKVRCIEGGRKMSINSV